MIIWNQWELTLKGILQWEPSTKQSMNARLSTLLGIHMRRIQPSQELKDATVLVGRRNNLHHRQLLSLHHLEVPKSTRIHQVLDKLRTWAEMRNLDSFKNWTMARAQASSCQIVHLLSFKLPLKREGLQLLLPEVAWWAWNHLKDQLCQVNLVNQEKAPSSQSHQRSWKTLFIKRIDLHMRKSSLTLLICSTLKKEFRIH